MLSRRVLFVPMMLALAGAAACGAEDAPVGGADPAGMGAGRPDTSSAAAEQPASEVLDGMDAMPTGTQQDTSAPGAGGARGGGPGAPR